MNILHVYKTFINDTMGGTEQVIAQIAATKTGSNFKHQVLSLSKANESLVNPFAGIENIRYKENFSIMSSAFSWSLLRDFKKITAQFDVIHYHFPWPFADLLHILCKIKKPSIVTYHSDIVRQKKMLYLYRPLMDKFLSSVDRLVATSPNYVKTSPVLQKYREKTTVIPIGISEEHYPKVSDILLKQWEERFGQRFFLFVGVMRYYKGLHILLKAIQNAPFTVLIVGTGPIENELKDEARKLKLNNVHFLGKLPDVDKIALLKLCLAMVFPSNVRSEAFGVSLLEAAMFGKPMVSTEIGTGTSYINLDKETGLVVPPNDADAFRQAMDYIYNNPEAAKKMGECARLRYESHFTSDAMVRSYESIYYEAKK